MTSHPRRTTLTSRVLRNLLLVLAALAVLVSPAVAQGRGQGNAHKQRGESRLLEQPRAANDHTAVVQVNDQGYQGNAWYGFTIDWQAGGLWRARGV